MSRICETRVSSYVERAPQAPQGKQPHLLDRHARQTKQTNVENIKGTAKEKRRRSRGKAKETLSLGNKPNDKDGGTRSKPPNAHLSKRLPSSEAKTSNIPSAPPTCTPPPRIKKDKTKQHSTDNSKARKPSPRKASSNPHERQQPRSPRSRQQQASEPTPPLQRIICQRSVGSIREEALRSFHLILS